MNETVRDHIKRARWCRGIATCGWLTIPLFGALGACNKTLPGLSAAGFAVFFFLDTRLSVGRKVPPV